MAVTKRYCGRCKKQYPLDQGYFYTAGFTCKTCAESGRERSMLEMHEAGATLAEVGARFGVGGERVRQLIRRWKHEREIDAQAVNA
jgi:hypothetical protein